MADIVLRDRSGNPLDYSGINKLKVKRADGETQAYAAYDPDTLIPENLAEGVVVGGVTGTLAVPESVEKTVELDFSAGDMEVTPDAGQVFSKVSIPVPDNLTPENIAKDMVVAGVTGTLEAGSGGGDMDALIEGTLTEIESYVETIRHNAFNSCSTLSKANFPMATTVYQSAFQDCSNLVSVSLPLANRIMPAAFSGCTELQTISLPECNAISMNVFYACFKLQSVYAPKASGIGSNAFEFCYSLNHVDSPLATYISRSAFHECSALTSAYFPAASLIGSSAFATCVNLAVASFPAVTEISNRAFSAASKLASLYLLTSAVPTLQSASAFYYTPLSSSGFLGKFGSIYVKSSLLASFKAATYWSLYSARIVGLTDDEIAALEG